MWDTSGDKMRRQLDLLFLDINCNIVIFVYSVNCKYSFEELKNFWFKAVVDKIGNNIIFGIAANKADLFSEEEVKTNEGIKFANEIGAIFRETSAKEDSKGIKLFINELIEKFLHKNELNIRKKRIEKNIKKLNLCKYFSL